ncbi:MAG: transglycosylase domain-containing protein [Trueperella sp.]|nr:transglycosylase domain-containing protein [Trueperella sp.]
MPNGDRQLSTNQLVRALISFLLMSIVGGGLLAATALPVVATSGTVTNAVTRIFDEAPTELDFTRPSEKSVILAADGSTLAHFYAENRIIVPADQISQFLKDAAVAIEDQRFYQHNGIDPKGIAGAAFSNLTTTGGLAGGSTITQQYVKNAMIEEGRILNDDRMVARATERTITRKLNEARYAIAVENKMSKEDILTGYLNLAQFGPSQWGVESASRYFFGVPASKVTLEQAAMLAGITQAPGRWDPVNNPEEAKKRRDTVLAKMHSLGMITEEQMTAAIAVPIADMLNVHPAQNGCEEAGISAYFCEYVVKEVLNSPLLGDTREKRIQALYRGGLTIKTTLEPKHQQAAYEAVTRSVPVGDASNTKMALSAVEPGTGKILAMTQNTNYGAVSKENPAATQVNLNVGTDMGGGQGFQSGSTFKVFTLVEWLKQGKSEYDTVNGSQASFPARMWNISCAPGFADTFRPTDLAGKPGGRMSVITATAQSMNRAFSHMATQLDLCDIVQTATDMGVRRGSYPTADEIAEFKTAGMDISEGKLTHLKPNPSMVLGTNEITPLSMAVSMATLAAEGEYCAPISFTEVIDANGKVIAAQEPKCKRVLDKNIALRTTKVLTQVIRPGATGANARLAGGRPVAGKTGTTNNAWHAWFTGYTPELATAIWMGHQEGNIPMLNLTVNGRYYRTVYGVTLAAPTFKQFMDTVLAGQPFTQFARPTGVSLREDEDLDDDEAEDTITSDENSTSPAENEASSVRVPSVRGMTLNEATAHLVRAGFNYQVHTEKSYMPKGQVISQNPQRGQMLPPGTTIHIVISDGR